MLHSLVEYHDFYDWKHVDYATVALSTGSIVTLSEPHVKEQVR